jgi:cytochrome b subunit of formate dehydrogenase
MEEKKLHVDYSGSGVKSLRAISVFFIILAIVGVILFPIGLIQIGNYEEEAGNTLLIVGTVFILQGCIVVPILRGLATIAETALINRHIIQTEYEISQSDNKKGCNYYFKKALAAFVKLFSAGA